MGRVFDSYEIILGLIIQVLGFIMISRLIESGLSNRLSSLYKDREAWTARPSCFRPQALGLTHMTNRQLHLFGGDDSTPLYNVSFSVIQPKPIGRLIKFSRDFKKAYFTNYSIQEPTPFRWILSLSKQINQKEAFLENL